MYNFKLVGLPYICDGAVIKSNTEIYTVSLIIKGHMLYYSLSLFPLPIIDFGLDKN